MKRLRSARRSRGLLIFLAVGMAMGVFALPSSAQIPSTDGDDQVSGQPYVRHDGGTDTGIAHCNDETSLDDGEDPAPSPPTRHDGRRQPPPGQRALLRGRPDRPRPGRGRLERLLPDRPRRRLAGVRVLDRSRRDVDRLDRARLPAGHVGRRDGVTAVRQPHRRRRPDRGLRQRGQPLRRRDLVQPRGADQRRRLRGDLPDRPAPERLPRRLRAHARSWAGARRRGTSRASSRTSRCSRSTARAAPRRQRVRVLVAVHRLGQNRILFSRSTDSGATFSRPFAITTPGLASVQGCDIAIEGDGDVYLTFRTFGDNSSHRADGLGFARSTDGGASFANARVIRTITPYAPADPARDCGDGPFECSTGFVFHRVPLEPRATADQSSAEDGVFLTYNEIRPGSTAPSDSVVLLGRRWPGRPVAGLRGGVAERRSHMERTGRGGSGREGPPVLP